MEVLGTLFLFSSFFTWVQPGWQHSPFSLIYFDDFVSACPFSLYTALVQTRSLQHGEQTRRWRCWSPLACFSLSTRIGCFQSSSHIGHFLDIGIFYCGYNQTLPWGLRLATWSLRGPRPLPILIQPFQLTLLFLHPLPPGLHHNPPDTILNELCIKSISKFSPTTTTERNFGSRNRTIMALSVQRNRRPTFSTWPGTTPTHATHRTIGEPSSKFPHDMSNIRSTTAILRSPLLCLPIQLGHWVRQHWQRNYATASSIQPTMPMISPSCQQSSTIVCPLQSSRHWLELSKHWLHRALLRRLRAPHFHRSSEHSRGESSEKRPCFGRGCVCVPSV